jgi:hypothetical protein
MLIGSLVVRHLLVRDFGRHVAIFVNVCVVITFAMVWRSFAVRGFRDLADNILAVIMSKDAFICWMLLYYNFQ